MGLKVSIIFYIDFKIIIMKIIKGEGNTVLEDKIGWDWQNTSKIVWSVSCYCTLN